MARRQTRTKGPLHDDSLLMIPPPGFKFIPKSDVICGKAGCFECFDIYCERCESKDRRIVELEMRNNDLVKYITQLQAKLFRSPSLLTRRSGSQASPPSGATPTAPGGWPYVGESSVAETCQRVTSENLDDAVKEQGGDDFSGSSGSGAAAPEAGNEPFAFIQSPVLYDPSMNLSYVATTSFAPAPVDCLSHSTAAGGKA